MADVDVDQWLEGWVENNLHGPGVTQSAAEMQSQAEVCLAEAAVAGISSGELTRAAGKDLASYLSDRQIARTSDQVGSVGAGDRF